MIRKSLLFLSVLVSSIVFIGCAGHTLTPEMQSITSVSDTANCKFVQSMYIETQPQTLTYYLKLNTHDSGGDSYKIISTNNQMIMGVNVMMTNFDIYKCK